MTTLQLYESIQQAFPKILQTQIILDMDASQKKFASDTGVLTGRRELSTIASNVAWTLPAEFEELTDVTFYDDSSEPVYIGQDSFQIGYEIEFNKFYIYATDSTPITGVPTAASSAYIHYVKTPTTLATISTDLEIPVAYREAIESDVLSKYFGKFPSPIGTDNAGNIILGINLRAAQWHRSEYDRVRIQAKRDYNSREHTEGEVITYDHAGKYALPRRVYDSAPSTTTTTQVSAITQIYANYVAFTAVSPSTLTETVAQIGYSTVAGTISSNTLALTSTAEFGLNTQIISNNTMVSWLYNSSSSITVTFPSGWGTIALEVYERV